MKRQIGIVVLGVVLLALLAGAAYASTQGPAVRDNAPAAATALTVQTLAITTGVTPTFASAAAAGNSFTNDGNTFLEVKNGSGAAVNITITVGSYAGFAFVDKSYTIPATTGDRMIGPFNPAIFGSSVVVNYASITTVTAAAFELPNP
jgi:hypothetical protein